MPSTILLKNATCLEPGTAHLFSSDVLIEGAEIRSVSAGLPAAGKETESVDLSGKVLMPGNVCAHTHLYSSLARGMPGPGVPPTSFTEILERIWWPLDRALDPELTYASALVGALDAVRAGTTCLIDHHASPESISGSLQTVSRALEEVGLRGILCYEITDRNGTEGRDEGLAESEAFLTDLRSNPRALLHGLVGGHASFTLSDDTLRRCADLVDRFGNGFHVHVAEDECDQRDALLKHGARVIDRLSAFGLLTRRAVLAHGVHLNDQEIAKVREAGAWLIHNPRSNLNNAVGHARVGQFGDRVALGTDGIGADLFEESKFGYFKARELSLNSDAADFLAMASRGASIATEAFGTPLGRIEPGALADLVVLDYDPPTPLTRENLAWHWIFGINSSMIESVMIHGRWIIRDRSFVNRNLSEDYSRARKVA
ncbi:MAG: putative aminohydrolase SsnA, partial [Acidobacteria bacterium]|nr:putative aminohydrolase SsnA [Acidobacteriota bacterium]